MSQTRYQSEMLLLASCESSRGKRFRVKLRGQSSCFPSAGPAGLNWANWKCEITVNDLDMKGCERDLKGTQDRIQCKSEFPSGSV